MVPGELLVDGPELDLNGGRRTLVLVTRDAEGKVHRARAGADRVESR